MKNHMGVQLLQVNTGVFGPGGPNTSKYLDSGDDFGGGIHFFVTV